MLLDISDVGLKLSANDLRMDVTLDIKEILRDSRHCCKTHIKKREHKASDKNSYVDNR